jgi:protein-disulfide isomerase
MSRLLLSAFALVVAASTVAQAAPDRQPDPSVTYAVPVGASPSIGSASAKVTIVMAIDFSCPYCRKAWGTVEALVDTYGADLRVVFKPFVVHPDQGTAAANASCAANKQGRWQAMAELLWTDAYDTNHFEQTNIDEIAVKAGLDPAQYQRDITGPCPAEIRTDMALLQRFAVRGTPTFFVNGRFIAGSRDIGDFERLIDEERAKASAAIDRGVPPEAFYEQEIVGKGTGAVPAS